MYKTRLVFCLFAEILDQTVEIKLESKLLFLSLALFDSFTIFRQNRVIGPTDKVFANGLGIKGSIPSGVKSKTPKLYLMLPCLMQHYEVQIDLW